MGSCKRRPPHHMPNSIIFEFPLAPPSTSTPKKGMATRAASPTGDTQGTTSKRAERAGLTVLQQGGALSKEKREEDKKIRSHRRMFGVYSVLSSDRQSDLISGASFLFKFIVARIRSRHQRSARCGKHQARHQTSSKQSLRVASSLCIFTMSTA